MSFWLNFIHFVHPFQVFQYGFVVVLFSEMNLEMYSGFLQLGEEDIKNNHQKEIECNNVNQD